MGADNFSGMWENGVCASKSNRTTLMHATKPLWNPSLKGAHGHLFLAENADLPPWQVAKAITAFPIVGTP